MLDGLIRWSLRNRLAVIAGAAIFLVWGGVVLRQMPVDVLPDVTAPTVTVLVEGQGMAPTDMEALVTLPIEAVMNGASGVRRVRSATAVGLAVVWVDFDWGEDIYRARQTVSEKLSSVVPQLPDAIGAAGARAALLDHGRDLVRGAGVAGALADRPAHHRRRRRAPTAPRHPGGRPGDGDRRRAPAVRGAGRPRPAVRLRAVADRGRGGVAARPTGTRRPGSARRGARST